MCFAVDVDWFCAAKENAYSCAFTDSVFAIDWNCDETKVTSMSLWLTEICHESAINIYSRRAHFDRVSSMPSAYQSPANRHYFSQVKHTWSTKTHAIEVFFVSKYGFSHTMQIHLTILINSNRQPKIPTMRFIRQKFTMPLRSSR